MMATKTEKHCSVEGCKRPYRAKGYCNVHFRKWRRGELSKSPRYKICGDEKCRKPLFRAGLCEEHYKAKLAAKKGAAEASITPAPAAVAEASAEATTPEGAA